LAARTEGQQTELIPLNADKEKEMNNRTRGAILASAVATLFLATAAVAQEAAPSSSGASAPSVKCVGANACKGQSSCKSAQNDCKGQNGCKGKGFVMTSTPEECTEKGGHAPS
jgi:uncharacterized membrane protein